jgi:F0F1-type ATP synthase assembly protein I
MNPAENPGSAEPPPDDLWKQVVQGLALLQFALAEVVGLPLLGAGIGWLAEKYLGFPRLGIVVLAIAGLALGMYRVYLASRRK